MEPFKSELQYKPPKEYPTDTIDWCTSLDIPTIVASVEISMSQYNLAKNTGKPIESNEKSFWLHNKLGNRIGIIITKEFQKETLAKSEADALEWIEMLKKRSDEASEAYKTRVDQRNQTIAKVHAECGTIKPSC